VRRWAVGWDTIRKLLDDSQKTLIPAIRALKGNRAYYVSIDRENNAMTNVSLWETLVDAKQMASLQAMLDLAKVLPDLNTYFGQVIEFAGLPAKFATTWHHA
jgi:hypothetical protein